MSRASQDPQTRLDELWSFVASIPAGSCATYGGLGRALSRPVSGLVVGYWMARCPEGLPWWRVVGSDGRLPIHKRAPQWADEQVSRLRQEGAPFHADGRVRLEDCGWAP
ncbi:MAG: MGMT family protein [Fimbriimonas ginsengisoli]|uniref:MGMT family protein n=1 Tax=Fimbriimonas ginsengisoli TaxID=1005039 RepID=A0A931M1Z1_FIMGI|nr:MGMT family protein [Fimbriimonas ginsengisoli]MBI3721899.1 MGMT family protein [Fimbriimonas ginsengisoli]